MNTIIRQSTWRHAMRASHTFIKPHSLVAPTTSMRQTTSASIRRSFFSTQTNNTDATTPSPSASASTSSSSSSTPSPSGASSSNSSGPDYSTPQSRARIVESARYHRRARLWLVAVITSAAAVVTYYRHLKQSRENKTELATRKAQIETATMELENMTRDQAERTEKAQKIINSLAPVTPATQQAPTPSSFLTAVSYDLRHKLQLGGVDPAVDVSLPRKAQTDKPNAVAVAAESEKAVEEAPKKPRKVVI